MKETSRDYRHPRRPLGARIGNALLGLGQPSLDPADLVEAARRAEGLTDLGRPDPRPALGHLCNALVREADLHPIGRWIQRFRIIGQLRNRLRATVRLRDDPAILDRQPAPPLVITGLPRTGTTFLHRLLAADPGTRALRSWEGLNPLPFRDGRDRIAAAQRAARSVAYLAPDFMAVHRSSWTRSRRRSCSSTTAGCPPCRRPP